jgi:hypothetical protein
MFELGKAEALMASIDALYMDFDFLPEEKQKAERGAYTFYCLMDAVQNAAKFLDEYTAECRIVDLIWANREAHGIEP